MGGIIVYWKMNLDFFMKLKKKRLYVINQAWIPYAK